MKNYTMFLNLNGWMSISDACRNVYWGKANWQNAADDIRCHLWLLNFQSSPSLYSKSDKFYLLNLSIRELSLINHVLHLQLLVRCSGLFYHPAHTSFIITFIMSYVHFLFTGLYSCCSTRTGVTSACVNRYCLTLCGYSITLHSSYLDSGKKNGNTLICSVFIRCLRV